MAIRDLLANTLDDARKKLPARVYSKELIEPLFHQPYTKGQFLVDAGIAERKTAAEYLKELERTGILKSKKISKENLYLNVKIYTMICCQNNMSMTWTTLFARGMTELKGK